MQMLNNEIEIEILRGDPKKKTYKKRISFLIVMSGVIDFSVVVFIVEVKIKKSIFTSITSRRVIDESKFLDPNKKGSSTI